MRKVQKRELLDILKDFLKLHREIEFAVHRGNIMEALQLLQDCQEYAISLNHMIEESEGKGMPTEALFAKYCEALNAVVKKLEKIGNSSCDRCSLSPLFVELDKENEAITQSIEKDIPVRKEIVFFPYKASMWDSLESIYLEAKKDTNCDVYCVPIPYYDKNPDGSVKELHYEGTEYPSDIEVIDWQSYHFEERRPDVIYIHNPYDRSNYVTSVHPRFYAENLKKYTDELVYIPYFVLEEIDPDDQEKIDGMKHFCVLPGVVYADKVILQSENMCQIYINEFSKALEAAGIATDREQLKEKFLGLGSPKYDKIQRMSREMLQVPEEWQQVIQKPDGSRKKVILYNTGVSALLAYGDKVLEKMKQVFDVFKELQEEVVLLWRPHPLMQATMESMRSELWEKYKEIVEQYKAEGWGIYDDTPDMNRAIILSDAYYGDGSSIVQLYRKIGKKVMIQCVDVLEETKK